MRVGRSSSRARTAERRETGNFFGTPIPSHRQLMSIPVYELIGEEGMEIIHEASMTILDSADHGRDAFGKLT